MQFIKNTSSSKKTFSALAIKFGLAFGLIFFIIFLLNKVEFPAPTKNIEKIIPNENFKIVK